MNSKRIHKMTVLEFRDMSFEEQLDFIETCQADFSVVQDLIRDRQIYRRVVNKLSKQLSDLGQKPITDYQSEVGYESKNKGDKKNG